MTPQVRAAHRATLAILLSSLIMGLATAARSAEIVWEKSYAEAVKKAKAKGLPIMVDFYADWCGWCKRLDSDVYTAPEVIKTAQGFVSVKLNTETSTEGQSLSKQHRVQGLPTILFLNPNGEVIGRLSGYQPAPQFREVMEGAAQVNTELPKVREAFQKQPKDVGVAVRLAVMSSKLDNEADTKRASERVSQLDPDDAGGHKLKALRALAELYVGRRDLTNAVAIFQQGAKAARRPDDMGYCMLSVGYGYLMQNNVRGGVRAMLAALRESRLGESDHKFARQVLDKIPTPLW